MATIEIDGKKCEAQAGQTIIQVADEVGIYIPRFCYHKKLSVAANCRMCLVQVGESKKAMPACATPVTDGMKVQTKSEIALKAQQAVMEFLLINHPLDCPICDQGGECELQDLALGFGADHSRYDEGKRTIAASNIGPLVQTDLTRCIQCTRCVRFGQEIAGIQELGMLNRGEHSYISASVDRALQSELSGNVIDVCPVGALTAKPSRFVARAWELQQQPSVSPHDCLGSHLYVHTRRHKVIRVVPKENEAINETWLSDRDRFSYEALHSPDRIAQPRIKKEGVWQNTDWLTALEFATEGLQKVLNKEGASQLAGLISPNATLEECFLFQKLLRGVGCDTIEHRLKSKSADCLPPSPTLRFSDIAILDAVLLIDAPISREQPLLSVRLRELMRRGGTLYSIAHYQPEKNLSFAQSILSDQPVFELAALAKALGVIDPCLDSIEINESHRALAKALQTSRKKALILGTTALNSADAGCVVSLAQKITEVLECSVISLTDGANGIGAIYTRCFSSQPFWQEKRKAYLLLGVEPEFDCTESHLARSALSQADFVVALHPFSSPDLLEHADVILPIAPFTETSGTYINAQGDWQSFTAVCKPYAEVRPAWKVLRVLANLLKVSECEYSSSEEVCAALQKDSSLSMPSLSEKKRALAVLPSPSQGITYLPHWGLYRGDALVRQAHSLQQTLPQELTLVIHSDLAAEWGFSSAKHLRAVQNNQSVKLRMQCTDRLAKNTVLWPAGFAATSAFDLSQPIMFEEVHDG